MIKKSVSLAIAVMMLASSMSLTVFAETRPQFNSGASGVLNQRIDDIRETYGVVVGVAARSMEDASLFLNNLVAALDMMGSNFTNRLASHYKDVDLLNGIDPPIGILIIAEQANGFAPSGLASDSGAILLVSNQLRDISVELIVHEFGHLFDFMNQPSSVFEDHSRRNNAFDNITGNAANHHMRGTIMAEAYANVFTELIVHRRSTEYWSLYLHGNWDSSHSMIVFHDIQRFVGNGSRATQRAAEFLNIQLPA